MLDEVTECYKNIVKAITRHQPIVIVAPDCDTVKQCLSDIKPQYPISYITVPTNDTWTRDFGAITTIYNGKWQICDFKFNGWGLKFASDKDNLVTRAMCENHFFKGEYCNYLGFVLEGGSIESDGKGTLLTTSTCLMSPNRNGDLNRAQIEQKLKDCLGANRILWIENGALAGDDTDSHIDTLARMAPNDTIIYVGCQDSSDEHYTCLKEMSIELKTLKTAAGKPYNLIELPLPDAIYDEDGVRLPATYANYLVTPKALYMPVYGQPMKDLMARQMLQIVFDQEIIEIDCRALIKQHGSLHCATMQLPKQIISII